MTPSSNSTEQKYYTPKKHLCADIYQAYVKKLLKDNPTYWTRYANKVRNYWVYRAVKTADKNYVETVISYPEFRNIMEQYYTRAKDYIILGGSLNIGANVGIIEARRVERNFSNRMVNFHETMKQPIGPDGKRERIIYFDDDDWVRIGWQKTDNIPNCGIYKFVPTAADMRGGGFKAEFSRANRRNPLLKYKYRYFPFIHDGTYYQQENA